MQQTDPKALAASIVLSLTFTTALLYSTLELPHILNRFLIERFPDYGLDWGRAEQFIGSVRPIGYLSLIIVLLLMALGFIFRRSTISFLGSLALYLPTFGYFAAFMFFLAGIGVVRIAWLPFLDFIQGSWPEKIYNVTWILELGDIVFLPYDLLSRLASLIASALDWNWITLKRTFSISFFLTLILLGLIFFLLGCIAWFYGRFRDIGLVDFWVYRHSRHPQYLGFLLWSYGMLIYDEFIFIPVRGGYFPSPPFIWLIATLVILGATLREETRMVEKRGEKYLEYRRGASFMLPMPKAFSRALTTPVRLLFKKDYPEKIGETFLILSIYLISIILASILYTPSG